MILYLKCYPNNVVELSPVEIPIEVITKKLEKRENIKAPNTIEPFSLNTYVNINNNINFVFEVDTLPLLTVEKPKSYLGLPPSNALLSRAIDNFNNGNLIFAKSDLQEFIKKYPESPYTYYAYYLAGYVDFINKNLKSSLENLAISCDKNPLRENCICAATVSILLNETDKAKKYLTALDRQDPDVMFLNEVINLVENKDIKPVKTDCNRVDISFAEACRYAKKYTEFKTGNYENSLKVEIKKDNSPFSRASIIIDGFSYYFTGNKQLALSIFDAYINDVSITDSLSNLAYYGKALTDERQAFNIAGILQTRNEELAQNLYMRIAENYLQKKEYLSGFLHLQSALAVYHKHKQDILKNIAVSMYNLKNYSYAKGIFKELADSTKDPEITLYAAFTCYKLKDFPEAEKYFQRLVDIPELKETALEYLANIYLQTKDYDSFVEVASKLRDINQNKAYDLLGWYFFEKGDYNNAFRSFRDPYMKAVSGFNLGDTSSAKKMLEGLYDEKSQLLKAYIYLKENDTQKAREVLKTIKDRGSRTSQEASYLYAFTYFTEGRFDIAATEFKNFIERYSSNNDDLTKKAYLRVADSYYNLGEVEIARKLYNDFISKYSNTKDAVNAAYSLLQLETKESKTDVKSAIESFISKYPDYPLNPALKIQLANLYAEEKNFEKAESIYRELIEKNIPESPTAFYQLINMFYKKGDFPRATSLSLEFIRRYPNSENMFNVKMILADIYEKQNNIDGALSIYYQIQDADQIKFKIAKLLIIKKDFQQALKYLQDLYGKYPDNRDLSLEIGKIYYQMSKTDDALNSFQEATKSDNPKTAAESYYYLGLIYRDKDINKSLNSFLNSIYINPQLDTINVNSRFEAAEILIKAEKRKEASCLLKEVLKYNDDQTKQRAESMLKDLPKCVY